MGHKRVARNHTHTHIHSLTYTHIHTLTQRVSSSLSRNFFALKLDIKVASALKICYILQLQSQLASQNCPRCVSWLSALSFFILVYFFFVFFFFNKLAFLSWIRCVVQKIANENSTHSPRRHSNCQLLGVFKEHADFVARLADTL